MNGSATRVRIELIVFNPAGQAITFSAANLAAPLEGMFFLRHDHENRICKITADTALERLLPILSIPWYDHETMARVIAQAKQLTANVPAYELSFKPDSSAPDFFIRSQKTFS